MAGISKVEHDTPDDGPYRQTSTNRIRRAFVAVLWSALAALSAICFYGGSQSHHGMLVVSNSGVSQNQPARKPTTGKEKSNTSQTQSAHYGAQLESGSELFRGNDLFVVSDVKFDSSPNLSFVIPNSLRLDPTSHDGRVAFQASPSFASSTSGETASSLPVSFRLRPYWKKVAPAALIIVILASILMAIPAFQRLRSDHYLKSRAALNTFSVGCVLLVVASMIGFNVGNPGWEYGDNNQFLTTTVQGEWMPPTIFPSLGRFFPLGLMDNNLLLPFGNNPLAYHIERSILLFIVVLTLFVLARRMTSVPIACLATFIFLTAPSLFKVYSLSIFPESQLIVWLMLFFLFYHRVTTYNGKSSTQALNVFVVCISAAAATYCKEPAFGLLLIFSAVQIVFGFAKQTTYTKFIHGFLAVNAIVFISLYWLSCSGGQSYADLRTAGTEATIISTVLMNFSSPMAILAIITGCFRAWRLMLCKDREYLFADGALFAGIGYAFAFCLLKLDGDYYMTPAHGCWAVAFAGYLANVIPDLINTQHYSAILDRNRERVRIAAAVVLLAVILQGTSMHKCINNQMGRRIKATELVKLFNHLDRDGVRLLAYMPKEIAGHAKCVQDWRKHTLNIFADCEIDQPRPVDSNSPFILADMKKIDQIQGRKLVICPPEYAHCFGDGKTPGQSWQRVEQYRHVMGALIYVQNIQVADYSDKPGDKPTNVARSRDQTNLK